MSCLAESDPRDDPILDFRDSHASRVPSQSPENFMAVQRNGLGKCALHCSDVPCGNNHVPRDPVPCSLTEESIRSFESNHGLKRVTLDLDCCIEEFGGSRDSCSTHSDPEQNTPSGSSVSSWHREDFGFVVADEGRVHQLPTRRNDSFLLDGVLELGGQDEGFKTINALQNQFQQVDADSSGDISQKELLIYALRLVEDCAGPLDQHLHAIVEEMVRRCYSDVSLGLHSDGIGEEEWIHFMMLHNSSPSYAAMKMLNEQLQSMPSFQPGLLEQIQIAFSACDLDGEGLVRRAHWERAVQAAGVYGVNVEDFDADEDGAIDYFEFVSCVSGCQPVEVELAMYDLSGGAASWIPSAFLGQKCEGVWHTGVRVYGKEYWYGGYIFEQEDFSLVPFGTPTRVVRLGTTLVGEAKFQQFMYSELTGNFRPRNYDVLMNNCNAFSNEVVQFLLNGKQIPDEILMQPSLVNRSTLAPFVVPFVNARFGKGHRMCHRIDDLTQEWRSRVRVGDMVLHRQRYVDRPSVALITGLDTVDSRRFADILLLASHTKGTWKDMWTLLPTRRTRVPDVQLFPCLEETEAGATILRVWRTVNRRAGTVLRRPPATVARPCCQQGHDLEASPSVWFGAQFRCTICRRRSAKMSCAACNFGVCDQCIARGTSVGAFADVLTPLQAEQLLEREEWMSFVAGVYFNRADICCRGWLDEHEIKSFCGRVCAELGIAAPTNQELFTFARLASDGAEPHRSRPGLGPEAFEILFKRLVQRVVRTSGSSIRVPFSACVKRTRWGGASFVL